MVPNGWEVKSLSDLASKISDGIHTTPIYTDFSNIYFINGNNLKNGSIVMHQSTKFVDEKDAIKHKRDIGERTLLMSINGTIGNLAYYRGENVVLGKSACYINIKENIDLDFIYYVLTDIKTQKFYESELTGTTIYNLSLKSIKATKVILPPLAEQQKIAQILSTWDKAIAVTEQLLANSQQQKKALMQQLLTGKKRLLDENGARFEGEWEEFSLGNIAKVYQPKTISQSQLSFDGYPVYGANGIIGYYCDFNHELEQIAVTCRGSTCGVVNWTMPKSWITGNAMVINVDNNSAISKKFLFYVLSNADLKYLITGSGQPQITGDIKNHVVHLASFKEQKVIAQVLTIADQEIEVLQRKLDCLQQEKKALMQQLLTGKRRVKVAA